jgi:carboxypeptidase C (cathepsin A)
MAAFVSIFFENFTKFKGRAFHMAGESYGVRNVSFVAHWVLKFVTQGRYVPPFASEVYDQNSQLIKAGLTPINLTSIIIGAY